VRASAKEIGLDLRMEDNSDDFFRLIKAPKHGHGRNMNPCIDCRIRNLNRAAALMREIGADFLVTGEVVGERPMSQNRGALSLIEKETGLKGLILRPLSAKLLATTIPEEKGWVDRERLLDISGRCRKPQLALARRFGLAHFESPAGGCLVTDPGFSFRLRELLNDSPDCGLDDVALLKVGRHFRLAPKVKAVVGRNQAENGHLISLAAEGDHLMEVAARPGPVTLVRGPVTEEQLREAGAITMAYGKAADMPSAIIRLWRPGREAEPERELAVSSAASQRIEALRIALG